VGRFICRDGHKTRPTPRTYGDQRLVSREAAPDAAEPTTMPFIAAAPDGRYPAAREEGFEEIADVV
jgi:hypothetical protein